MAIIRMLRAADGKEVPILEGDVPAMMAEGYQFVREIDRKRFAPDSPTELVQMIRPDGSEVPIRAGDVGVHLSLGYKPKIEAKDAPSEAQPSPLPPPSETVEIPAPDPPAVRDEAEEDE